MAFPVGLPTRNVSFGAAVIFEDGTPLSMTVEIMASDSLVWGPTGTPLITYKRTWTGSVGQERIMPLPITDSPNYRTTMGGIVDVSDGKQSHSYSGRISYRLGNSEIKLAQFGPFVLPAGDGTVVDIDLLIPLAGPTGVVITIPDSWSASVEASEQAATDSATSAAEAQASAASAQLSAGNSAGGAAASATAAAGSASAAQTSANAASASETAAQTARTGAETARTGAETARTGAETARTGAEAAQTIAQAQSYAGTDLAGADLNNITTAGVYRQGTGGTATLALNYPVAGLTGVLEVLTANAAGTANLMQRFTSVSGTQRVVFVRRRVSSVWGAWAPLASQRSVKVAGQLIPDILTWDEVDLVERRLGQVSVSLGATDLNTVTTDGVYQQTLTGNATLVLNYPIAGYLGTLEVTSGGTMQRWTPRSTATRGHYVRVFASSAWQPWRFTPTTRVDQTAGRAMYAMDEFNNREQLIWGDTGLRDVSADLLNGWAGTAHIRRQGTTVTLRLLVAGGTATQAIPNTSFNGFSPMGLCRFAVAISSSTLNVAYWETNGINLNTGVAYGSASRGCEVNWQTTQNWPTVLPGVATGGAIPNL